MLATQYCFLNKKGKRFYFLTFTMLGQDGAAGMGFLTILRASDAEIATAAVRIESIWEMI